jgi:hypothetical protein
MARRRAPVVPFHKGESGRVGRGRVRLHDRIRVKKALRAKPPAKESATSQARKLSQMPMGERDA